MVKLVSKMRKKRVVSFLLWHNRERESIARVKIQSSDELGNVGHVQQRKRWRNDFEVEATHIQKRQFSGPTKSLRRYERSGGQTTSKRSV